MPKAEFGTQKHLANQMKSKGLQRLRWWCQACEKQCRDANGYKCHTQSESHVRKMQTIGQDAKTYINNFSTDFQRDFCTLLRVAHGEKPIGANRFYNEYIRDKEHVHLNATRWNSLTEFIKHIGREGIVTISEDEKDAAGLKIAWRDTSVDAVRRREDIRAQERAEAKSGTGEEKLLKRMVQRAKEEAEAKAKAAEAKRLEEEAQKAAEKTLESPPATASESAGTPPLEEGTKTDETPKPVEAQKPPAIISFGLKTKVPLTRKTGLAQANKQSIFKRARTENGDDNPAKKVKM